MRPLIFFGSDAYSGVVLRELISAGHPPTHLITPKADSPLVTLANSANIKVLLYQDLLTDMYNLITPDSVGLSASFPLLFPPALIEAFGGRLYNLHPSLLPQYRNVAPVPYAIALGDSVTGITLHRISEGIDNGEIVGQVSEPIQSADTARILLHRLFAKGAQLFLDFLQGSLPCNPHLTASPLIFTSRLNSESGYIEWSVLQKLLSNTRVDPSETTNPLLRLRLTHNPRGEILHDLIRGLTGWEKVWTVAPTKKGELRLALISNSRSLIPDVLISGKPKPISYSDFAQYYL